MLVSNRNLLFQGSIFRGYVSFRGCIPVAPLRLVLNFLVCKYHDILQTWEVFGGFKVGTSGAGDRLAEHSGQISSRPHTGPDFPQMVVKSKGNGTPYFREI